VFEDHKAKKAAKEHSDAMARWEAIRADQAELVTTAQSYRGSTADGLMLKSGEAVFYKVTNCSLVEERRGVGHYRGRSSGVSIPVGFGVRYRTGASRGHYVQGSPTPTSIDVGTVFITNQRVIFRGNRQTRECAFAKLIGYEHSDDGSTTFSVSNRQKPTVTFYGPQLSGHFEFRLDLALAHYRGDVNEFVGKLKEGLAEIDQQRPPELPQGLPPAPAATQPIELAPAPPSASVAPGWYADPWGKSALRWWDGSRWTGNVHDDPRSPAP